MHNDGLDSLGMWGAREKASCRFESGHWDQQESDVSDLNFNIYAFVKPTTREEYSALLDEALRMAEQLEQMVDDMGAWLKANAKPL